MQVHIPKELFVQYPRTDKPGIIHVFQLQSNFVSELLRGLKNSVFIRFIYEDKQKYLTFISIGNNNDNSTHQIPILNLNTQNIPKNEFVELINQRLQDPIMSPMQCWFPIGKIKQSLSSARSVTDRLQPPPLILKYNLNDPTEWKLCTPPTTSFSPHEFKVSYFSQQINSWSDVVQSYSSEFPVILWPILMLTGDICKRHARIWSSDKLEGGSIHIDIVLDWHMTLRVSFLHYEALSQLRSQNKHLVEPTPMDEIDKILLQS